MNIFSKDFLFFGSLYERTEFYIEAFNNSKNKTPKNLNKFAKKMHWCYFPEIVIKCIHENEELTEAVQFLKKNESINKMKANKVSKKQFYRNLFQMYAQDEREYDVSLDFLNIKNKKPYAYYLTVINEICSYLGIEE